MNVPDTAMIFAAGLGTRMGEITRTTPKALVRIGNETLLDHTLGHLTQAGVSRAVVNVHHLADQIETHLSTVTAPAITLSDERDLLRETGGGLRHAADLVGPDPILTANADVVWTGGNPVQTLARTWDPERMDALLLVVETSRAIGHLKAGDFFMDDAGRPTRRGQADHAPYVYASMQIIRPGIAVAHDAEVFSLNVIWDQLIATGRLFLAPFDGNWCDVGQPSSIPLAEALVK
ncbi:nucleotidyltransferase family protein [Halovulum sp. GXIMD14793]